MSPAFVFSAIISTGVGLAYHLWRGGGLRRMLLFVIAAWSGFAIGQVIGSLLGWRLLVVGEVHLVEGIIGSLLALVIAGRPD